MNGLTVTSPPATTPISVAQAKDHLRLADDGAEDVLIRAYIEAAAEMIERQTGKALVARGYTYALWGFPDPRRELTLPMPPLVSVESVTHLDAGGTPQTIEPAAYHLDRTTTPGRIVPVEAWPATPYRPEAVVIAYTAGFPEPASIPADLLAALRLIVGHLYENREASAAVQLHEVPMAVQTILTEHARPRL